MKPILKFSVFIFLMAVVIFISCKKEKISANNISNQPPVANAGPDQIITLPIDSVVLDGSASTDADGQIVNYKWTKVSGPVSSLIINPVSIASAGDKILFAGGANVYDLSSTVDIYDVNTQRWSTASLSVPRYAIAAVAAGNKIFFAGGYNGDDFNPITYSTVDIYDAYANTWSVTSMSVSAGGRAAAVLNNKIFFAGGFYSNGLGTHGSFPATVDIYDLGTSTWSKTQLSEGREGLSATTAGGKIYFAGGLSNNLSSSNKIDIYNGNDATWSESTLSQARGYMASITIGDKIYWAGGAVQYKPNSSTVEIRDINTQTSSFACLSQPNAWFEAVIKDNKIIFFTGAEWVPHAKNKFDIYDITTGTWSIGVLNQDIAGASIISVKDVIYIALGNQVWKLDF